MASKQSNVDFVLEQMAEAGDVSARKMFGEFGIYCAGKIVALFCDDQLFIKPTPRGRKFIGTVTEGAPYPGAKPWFLVRGDACEDGSWLSELVRITAEELPPPKAKPPRRPTTAAKSAARAATKEKPARKPAQATRAAKTTKNIRKTNTKAASKKKASAARQAAGRSPGR